MSSVRKQGRLTYYCYKEFLYLSLMTFPHSLKAGAILAILMVPVLTAQAFNLDFD